MKKIYWILIMFVAVAVVAIFIFRNGGDSFEDSGGSLAIPDSEKLDGLREVDLVDTVVEGTLPENEDRGLSDNVCTILSGEASFKARALLIDGLGRDLSADDVAALRDFLNASVEEYSDLSPIALNSLKNDVFYVLLDQVDMPSGMGQQIVDLFNDPDADYMWREYCLQFMEPLYSRQSEDAGPDVEQNLDLVQKTLLSALDERDADLAGTALLGLHRLARDHEEAFDSDQMIAGAVQIVEDASASDRCRLTALRVAAGAECAEVLPAARQLAQNAPTDLLRAAAITTLGDFADPQDRKLLSKLALTDNRQISSAARSALARYK